MSEGEIKRIVTLAAALALPCASRRSTSTYGSANFSKLAMARRFAADILGIDTTTAAEKLVFVGDSPNDVSMFGYFPDSVGVANVLKFRDRLEASQPTSRLARAVTVS